MSYLPPCRKNGSAYPARGIDALGGNDASRYSEGFVTKLSEYNLSGLFTGSGASFPVWPAIISRPVRYIPTKVPIKGNTNLRKWILRAVSSCIPIQKVPPIQPGMITNSANGNLSKNSHKLVFTVINLFNMPLTPRLALRKLQ
jgi:hypothetical protein